MYSPPPVPLPFNRLFCPVDPDRCDDMAVETGAASAIKHLPRMVGPTIVGGTKGLKPLNPWAKLYLLAHGHAELPHFTIGKTKTKTWTAIEMAKLLERTGLNKEHRELILLVCHAGQTLGEKTIVSQRMDIQKQKTGVDKLINQFERKQQFSKQMEEEQKRRLLKNQYDKLAVHKPKTFDAETQLLPMVSQLIQQLKNMKYKNIRITSYMGEVSNNFSEGIKVKVDGIYVPADGSNTKIWH